jgi:hypothetical protein
MVANVSLPEILPAEKGYRLLAGGPYELHNSFLPNIPPTRVALTAADWAYAEEDKPHTAQSFRVRANLDAGLDPKQQFLPPHRQTQAPATFLSTSPSVPVAGHVPAAAPDFVTAPLPLSQGPPFLSSFFPSAAGPCGVVPGKASVGMNVADPGEGIIASGIGSSEATSRAALQLTHLQSTPQLVSYHFDESDLLY